MTLLAVACVLAALVAAAAAEDVTEATTFGADGIATQSLGVHYEETEFRGLEARADGGLVAQRDRWVEAYLANGAPDQAAPPQRVPDNRKVFPVAGGKSLVLVERHLTRVNPDGSADASFGVSGTVRLPGWPDRVAELPSGKILLATARTIGTRTLFSMVEISLLNPDGSVDRGLGKNGLLEVSLPTDQEGTHLSEIDPTADGGALLVGGTFLLELRANGTPNPGFGKHGLISSLPSLVGGRVLPGGSVAAVGYERDQSGSDLVSLRFTATGAPDSAFGLDGRRSFDLGGEEEARVASWAVDGSVIVGGSVRIPNGCPGLEEGECEETPLLAAFDPAGNLDPGFGAGGALRLTSLAGPPDWYPGGGVTELVRRPDGSIVAGGTGPPERTVAYLAAVSPRGELLPGFGEAGIVRLPRALPAIQSVTGFAPLPNGQLLAAASTDIGIEKGSVLVRYADDGSLDRSFGNGAGYVPVAASHPAAGFALSASGQALIGTFDFPSSGLSLRSAADGAPVSSFGYDGDVPLPTNLVIEALAFAADGGALVVASHNSVADREPGVVLRYRSDGKLDSGFGDAGRVLPEPPGGAEFRARALATAPGDASSSPAWPVTASPSPGCSPTAGRTPGSATTAGRCSDWAEAPGRWR